MESPWPCYLRRIMKSTLIAAQLFLLALLACQATASADNRPTGGAIRGTITDPAGRPIFKAEVLHPSDGSGTLSDRHGQFFFGDLPLGTLSLLITHVAFEPGTLENFSVSRGDTLDVGTIVLAFRIFDAGRISITADRPGRSARDAATPINMIQEEAIAERASRTTAETLREEPGVAVQKTSHGGGSPIIRGLSSNRVLILVDGIRLNNSTFRLGNHQYLTTIDYQAAQGIEVVRGPTSVLYGSDAMGGTINVITRRAQFTGDSFHLNYNFRARFASADQEKMTAAAVSAGNKKIAIQFGLTLKDYGHLKRGRASTHSELERATNGTEQRPTAFYGHDFDLKTIYHLSSDRTFIVAWQETRQSDVPRYDKYENNNHYRWLYEPQNRDLVYALYEMKRLSGRIREVRASLSRHWQEEGREIQPSESSPITMELDVVRTTGTLFEVEAALGKHLFRVGTEFYFDEVASERSTVAPLTEIATPEARGRYPDGSSYGSFGLFAHNRYSFHPHWSALAGLRASFFEARFDDITDHQTTGRVEHSFDAITSSAGMVYAPAGGLIVNANVAQAFRAPNLSDLTKLGESKGNVYEIPNSNLEPENLLSFDLGGRWESERWQADLSLWYSSIHDLIASADTTLDGSPTIEIGDELFEIKTRKNIGRGFLRGVDALASLSPTASITIGTNLSYAYGENETNDEPADGVPPLSGGTYLKWKDDTRYISSSVRWARRQDRLSSDDLDDPRIPAGGTPSWYLFNLRAGFRLGRQAHFRFALENLLDRNYREHGSGLNGPGRSLVIGLEFSNRAPSG